MLKLWFLQYADESWSVARKKRESIIRFIIDIKHFLGIVEREKEKETHTHTLRDFATTMSKTKSSPSSLSTMQFLHLAVYTQAYPYTDGGSLN